MRARRGTVRWGATASIAALVMLSSFTVVVAERLPLRTYTVLEGLPHDRVEKIVRDSEGFLWFCTVGGLSRFDGHGFRTFGVDDGLPFGFPVLGLHAAAHTNTPSSVSCAIRSSE